MHRACLKCFICKMIFMPDTTILFSGDHMYISIFSNIYKFKYSKRYSCGENYNAINEHITTSLNYDSMINLWGGTFFYLLSRGIRECCHLPKKIKRLTFPLRFYINFFTCIFPGVISHFYNILFSI